MHVHILGICGTLMGSIALLAQKQGHKVTGSDENIYPPMSDQLSQQGITISTPYIPENIPSDVDLVMIGNANLPRGNLAVEHVLEKNIPYISGAEWLGRYLLHDKWVLAVAGTHGKTTTTSMLAWILEFAGLKPGFLVGGIPSNFNESARLGETPFFVIEADEYDTSYFDRRSKFLHYHPKTLIINNLEYDHADIFPDLDAIQNQFNLLLRTVPQSGLIIYPEDNKNINTVLDRGCWSERFPLGASGQLFAEKVKNDYSEFEVLLKNKGAGRVSWALTGKHNMDNALSAIAAARHVGVTPVIACEALCEFKGVKRRMECIFESDTTMIYDDFAHHPTAISTTLEGLRKKVTNDYIMVIVELGSHTMRLGIHESTLKGAVQQADEVLWFQPEKISWDMHSRLADENSQIVDSIDTLAQIAIEKIQSGQVKHLVIMSNSGFGGLHKKIVDQL
ncbi:MAG: UDP-N-acetylmuramate: L-alanyl-gamma-D-glutamyl-meso-diaminopimelate ligase [Candidatus Azotimanducaceae bacterium]